MKLIFASNNQHKLFEVRQILPTSIEVISLQDVGFLKEIEETGSTLDENSMLKAQEVWSWINDKKPMDSIDGIFADDTGLEIAALGGAPGVHTARWAGENACDINNRQKVLRELTNESNRKARFRTIISLITRKEVIQVEGIVNGTIATQEEGNGGFGYDPIFIPEGYMNTFASLPADIKNNISHRGRAMEELKDVLTQYLTNTL